MKKVAFTLSAVLLAACAEASWYWPFGDDEEEPPRLSELVEKASELIGEGSDLAADGKVTDAVAKYKAALAELDRVERENPDRAKTTEFASLKTKRAYVEATIDALLMNQARQNAKAVAVSDTAKLEQRLADERSGKTLAQARAKREAVIKAVGERDFATADKLIGELLAVSPNDVAALNLKAARETAEGKYEDAERTLGAAIKSNPKDYYAYYNMALLKLQTNPEDKAAPREYYTQGKKLGGPKVAEIEEKIR